MEDNKPTGRKKHVSGQVSGVNKREEGLGTGPVGKQDGYQGRKQQYQSQQRPSSGFQSPQGNGTRPSQTFQSSGNSGSTGSGGITRAGKMGIGGILIIALLVFMLYKCACSGRGNLLEGPGGDGGTQQQQQGGGFSDILTSLMSGAGASGSGISQGWVSEANTGKLNTNVVQGSREKRTTILGSNRDVITVMVYMCGTDLESKHGMGSSDIQEMINARYGSNINIILLTGGCKQWKNNIVSSSVNQIYKVESGNFVKLVENAGNDCMTDPDLLAGFIKYCKQNYPANRYDLILWDHGGGSVSGYGYDEKYASKGSMSLKGINEALKKADVKFDFIGFDACLMATLETALMLEPYADYMIASEETEPGVGWYYTDWLTALGGNTSMSTLEVGKNIVDSFVNECNKKCAGQNTTLSVVDLAELGYTVGNKFSDFSNKTSEQIKTDYQTVSNARASAREFAVSSKIDQIDLVHLAYNLNTTESKALADTILSAVKYNRTSSNMTNCYGLSIFFPYKKSSKVDSAVATYNAIGLDSAYSRCIQQFASMSVSGQAVGTTASADGISSILGGGSASSGSSFDLTSLLGGLLGGGSLLSGLTGGSSDFFGKGLEGVDTAAYIGAHRLDPANLVWTKNSDGKNVISLSKEQWDAVSDLALNVFYDDGAGYIDLGLDNIYSFTDAGELIGEYEGTWLGINGQLVAYYFVSQTTEGGNRVITGRVPVLVNGERAELYINFESAKDDVGEVVGVRMVYDDSVTETVAKLYTISEAIENAEGDLTIDFICDYYNYNGDYVDSYKIGEPVVLNAGNATLTVSDLEIADHQSKTKATYLFTDIYCQEYWTPVMP
ncbi:MAG: peptidase C11 [Clostridia bacterium]|nr:peptidase C11 [Clostridia bacterium]